MTPTITGKQLARYLGSRYKNAIRAAKMFYQGADTGTTDLHEHYRRVAADYMDQATMWRETIRHWKTGDLATWQ